MLNKGPRIIEAVKTLDDILTRMQGHQRKKRARLRAALVGSWIERRFGIDDIEALADQPATGADAGLLQKSWVNLQPIIDPISFRSGWCEPCLSMLSAVGA